MFDIEKCQNKIPDDIELRDLLLNTDLVVNGENNDLIINVENTEEQKIDTLNNNDSEVPNLNEGAYCNDDTIIDIAINKIENNMETSLKLPTTNDENIFLHVSLFFSSYKIYYVF